MKNGEPFDSRQMARPISTNNGEKQIRAMKDNTTSRALLIKGL
jgi:hypothetical protein